MIEINQKFLSNTGNPIKDFSAAIEKEGLEVNIGQIYKIGQILFSFYSWNGNLVGLNHYKLQKNIGGKNLYYHTRIQPNLKRIGVGFCEINI